MTPAPCAANNSLRNRQEKAIMTKASACIQWQLCAAITASESVCHVMSCNVTTSWYCTVDDIQLTPVMLLILMVCTWTTLWSVALSVCRERACHPWQSWYFPFIPIVLQKPCQLWLSPAIKLVPSLMLLELDLSNHIATCAHDSCAATREANVSHSMTDTELQSLSDVH